MRCIKMEWSTLRMEAVRSLSALKVRKGSYEMKRIIAMLLCVIMLLGLCACSVAAPKQPEQGQNISQNGAQQLGNLSDRPVSLWIRST